MPAWAQWVTFGIALLGAGLGVFNAAINFRRGRPRVFAVCTVEKDHEGADDLVIEVVNTGHVPVTVNDVGLARVPAAQPWVAIHKQPPHHVWKGQKLEPGDRLRIRANGAHLRSPFMAAVYGVAVQLAGAKTVNLPSDVLRENAAQLKAAARATARAARKEAAKG